MKLLITGASGQLGVELIRALEAGRSELGDIPAAYAGCQVLAADLPELDIADGQAVHAFVTRHKPDIILNCAAMTNVDACETDPETAYRVNALGARNLAIAASETGGRLVQVSTDYVFAGDGTQPYCEWDRPAPRTVYGKSKLLGEQYVSGFCKRHFIVRTAWLYGYTGHNFVKTIVKAARGKGQLKVVDDQRGNPTHAGDLAHHLLGLAVTGAYGVYHCSGGGECTWYEFACEIVRLAGIPCEITPCTTAEFPRPAPRPAYSSLRNLAFSCSAGDEMRPWQEALASFFANWKEESL